MYLMDLPKGSCALDAFQARNHSAFAAFACRKKFSNMCKRHTYTSHWDKKIPHVGFYATRDIEPYEELTYLRIDKEDKNSTINCHCGHPDCSGLL